MTVWRDPLDELIDDLETALPATAAFSGSRLPRIEEVQEAIGPLLFGCPGRPVELTTEQETKLDRIVEQWAAALGRV
jgi:hypothetical protein